MATSLEDLQVLRLAEMISDKVWAEVATWQQFPREVVGGQLTRAIDSIGANIAESYGRFHYGEKINFLYFARGSLFEAKYWLNRCMARSLMQSARVEEYVRQLTDLARQLNAFAANLKAQRKEASPPSRALREATDTYTASPAGDDVIFSEDELNWLGEISQPSQSLISNRLKC